MLELDDGGLDHNAISLNNFLKELVLAGKPFLPQREQLSYLSRYWVEDNLKPLVDVKIDRSLARQGDIVKIKLFKYELQSIGLTICGGKIGTSGPTTCVSSVVPKNYSCFVCSHSTKDKRLTKNVIYVQTPLVVVKRAVYLTLTLSVLDVSTNTIPSLLNAKLSVKV